VRPTSQRVDIAALTEISDRLCDRFQAVVLVDVFRDLLTCLATFGVLCFQGAKCL
jgi:hypothetical protein